MHNTKNRNRLAYLLTVILLVLLVVYMSINHRNRHAGLNEVEDFNGAWEIAVDGITIEGNSLYDLMQYLKTQNVYHGMKIRLSRKMVVKEKTQVPSLMFDCQDCAYQVIYDRREIKSEYFDQLVARKFIGGDIQYVALPQEVGEHELTIWLYIGRANSSIYIDNIQYGSYDALEQEFLHYRLLAMIIGIFLVVFGGIFSFIALLFNSMMPEMRTQLYSSLMCLNLGIWIHSYYNILGYVSNGEASRAISYICVYLMLPLGYLILSSIHETDIHRPIKIWAVSTTVFSVLMVMLHLLQWGYIGALLNVYFALCVIALIIMIGYYIKDLRKGGERNIAEWTQMNGLMFLDAAMTIGILMFVARERLYIIPEWLYFNYFPVVSFIYAAIQLIIYLTIITESYAFRQESASLSHLAYADGLTDLANRARCDQYMAELDRVKDTDFCIISLDVNGLKEVNDKLGHLAGDRLLKDFSGVLKKCFTDIGFVSRIGGDEFMVIIDSISEKQVEQLLRRMNEALHAMNVIYSQYYRSAAYGYAFRHECDSGKSHDVYLLADQRMYELKHKQHLKLKLQDRV